MDRLEEYLKTTFGLDEDDWAIFSSKLTETIYPKKILILKTGQTENYLSFIKKGIVRLYLPKKEDELTFGFFF